MDGQSPHPRNLSGFTTPKAQVIDNSSLILSPPPAPARHTTAIIRKDYGKNFSRVILGLGIEECMAQLGLHDDEHHHDDPTTACNFFDACNSFPSLPRYGDNSSADAGMNLSHENGGVVMFGLLSAPTRLVRPRVQRFRSLSDEATRGGTTAARIHDMTLSAPPFPSLTTPSEFSSPMPFIPKLTDTGEWKRKLETRPDKRQLPKPVDDSLLAI